MSSLSRQLESHRFTAGSSSVRLVNKKNKRPSLLFSEGEAADLDRQTIYHLGLNGLQELITTHGAHGLLPFKESLFSKSMAFKDRNLEDQDFNTTLNQAIELCLLELAPYFLLKPAQKVLEFLIRQFEVQVHNADSLLACALPFHDTEFFVRLLSLPVEIQDTQWAFLKPVAKTKQPLTRPQLVKACLSEMGVLRSTANQVERQVENHKMASFFAVLASEVIFQASVGKKHGSRNQSLLDEKVVPILVPAALDAIRDKGREERQRAGYIIAAQLAKHCELSDKATKLFLLSIIRKASAQTLSDSLQCSALVLFFGPNSETLPSKCVQRLFTKFAPEQVAQALQDAFTELPSSTTAERFLTDMYKQLVSDSSEKAAQLLVACVERCFPPNATALFTSIAKQYAQDDVSDETKDAFQKVAQRLATVQPSSVDRALDKSADNECFAFASACFAHGSESAVVASKPIDADGSHTTLRLALVHVQSSVRAHALEQLASLNPTWKTIDFGILLDRITDDDATVSFNALSLVKTILLAADPVEILSLSNARHLIDAISRSIVLRYSSSSSPSASFLQSVLECIAAFQPKHVDANETALFDFVSDMLLISAQAFHRGYSTVASSKDCKDSDLKLCRIAFESAKSLALHFDQATSFACLFDFEMPKKLTSRQTPLSLWGAHMSSSNDALTAAIKLTERALASGCSPRAFVSLACAMSFCAASNPKEVSAENRRAIFKLSATICSLPAVWGLTGSESSTEADTTETLLDIQLSEENLKQRAALIREAVDNLAQALNEKNDTTTAEDLEQTYDSGELPASLQLLCTLLGAPDVAFKFGFGSIVQKLLQDFFSKCVLRTLLLLSSGALDRRQTIAQKRALVLSNALMLAASSGKDKLNFVDAAPFLLPALSHKEDPAIRAAGVDCVKTCLASSKNKSLYLGYVDNASSSAVEMFSLPKSKAKSGLESKPACMVPLLQRIVENAKEIETDASTLERLLRTMANEKDSQAIAAVLERAACLLESTAVPEHHDTRKGSFSVPRCVESISRIIISMVPVVALGNATCFLARAAVEKNLDRLLALSTKRWAEAGAVVDTQVILAALEKGQVARSTVLRALKMEHVYNQLKESEQNEAFDLLCAIASTNDAKHHLAEEAVAAFRVIPFSGSLLRQRLGRPKLSDKQRTIYLEAARARLFHDENIDPSLDAELCIQVLPPLFKHLENGCMDVVLLAALNKTVQIILSLIKNKVLKAKDKKLATALTCLSLETVVQCVLSAVSAPARNASLEFLKSCTLLFPTKAIEVVVSILKSINGQNVSEEDSEEGTVSPYTFVVLEQLTKCVAASTLGAQNQAQIVTAISLFVETSCKSSETSRLLNLYEVLIQSLSRDNSSLWAVIVFLLANAVRENKESNNLEHQLWMAHELALRFSVQDQVYALMQITQSIHKLLPSKQPLEDDQESMEDADDAFHNDASDEESDMEIDEVNNSSGTILPAKSRRNAVSGLARSLLESCKEMLDDTERFALVDGLVKLLSAHLSGKNFMRLLRNMSQEKLKSSKLEGSEGFLGLLHHLHRQIHHCTVEEEEASEELAERWSTVREELCNALDKISSLLSVPLFVGVLKELLRDEDAHVRHLAIRQLSSKVAQQHERWRPEETLVFLEMVSQLHEIIKNDDESQVNKQTALLSIDVLARYLGSQHPKPFAAVLGSVVKVLEAANVVLRDAADQKDTSTKKKSGQKNKKPASKNVANLLECIQLSSSACLCVGTMLDILGQKALSHLPKFAKEILFGFQQLLDFAEERGVTLDDEGNALFENDEQGAARMMLAQSAASSVFCLVSNLPAFLSPYLADLLVLVGSGDKEGVPALIRATSARIGERIAEKVDPRLLLSPIAKVFAQFVEKKDLAAAERIVSVLQACVSGLDKEGLAKHLVTLAQFFASTLDVRFVVQQECTSAEELDACNPEIESLEESVVDSYLELVMMLSRPQMKMTFNVLCDMARSSKALPSSSSSGTTTASVVTGADDLFSSLSDNKKRKSSTDEPEDEEDSLTIHGDRSGSGDWRRQCRACSFYLLCKHLGEKLLSLSGPFLSSVVDDLVADLQASIDATESSSMGENSEESDGDSSSSAEESQHGGVDNNKISSKRRAKKRKVTTEEGSSAEGDEESQDNVLRQQLWRKQQRMVRERAMDVITLFCTYGQDSMLDSHSQPNKRFSNVLDAILVNMDVDRHILASDGNSEELATYFTEFLQKHLRTALVHLAQAISEETAWQTLHHAVLEFGKHASPAVRAAMIETVVCLFEEVGEGYIVLLADTLPTIAELLEDSDRQVKQTAHRAAKKLQQLSGEDLTTFLQ